MSKEFFARSFQRFDAELNAIVETLISSAGQECDTKIRAMPDKEFWELYRRVMAIYRKRKGIVGGPEVPIYA
mgnify:CR=1 FL=1